MTSKRPAAPYDEEFARFLAQKGAAHSRFYMEHPETAMRLFRNPNSAMVWWARQEYDNTEEHRKDLKHRIERVSTEVDDLKRKLVAAEERPSVSEKKAEPSMRCAKGHPLVDYDGRDDRGLCHVCYHFVDNISKWCEQCEVGACAACMEDCGPNEDMGLQFFMAEKGSAFTTYRINRKLQKEGHDLFQPEENRREINRLREEFYDTEQHRVDLKEQINEVEAVLEGIRTKLTDAERRAAQA